MERLDKLIADRACVSRRDAKALIRKGVVTVNGKAASPEQKCGEKDVVLLEGKQLCLTPLVYLMLNKPAGVVCATRDPACETVLDLLPKPLRRKGLFPAGRLDKDTEGFVLITNDGAFAHRILSPKNHIPKTYLAVLDAPADVEKLSKHFARGMDLGGGDFVSPAQLRLVEGGPNPVVEVVIHEGVYHQVKRMFGKYSLNVRYLKRVKIGWLPLDPALGPGESRELSAEEKEAISAKSGSITV